MSSVVEHELLVAPEPAPLAPKPVVTALGLAALTVELSACGGGGGSAAAPPPPAPAPAPMTVSDAGRFLTQATLGFTRNDITGLMASSYSAWVDAQLALPRSQGHYDWLIANGYNAAANINGSTGLDNTIWRKFISSPDGLRQRVVLALSEICVASVLGIDANWRQFSVANYLDILEANAFGNYRTLLQQISLSPAMSYYLTYRGSAKANPKTGSEPDENYARELMQLFTIGLLKLNNDGSVQTNGAGAGVESYTQDDVSGLARVFTGWNIDVTGFASPYPPDIQQRPLVSTASKYETGAKTFLGTTIPAGTSATNSLTMALDALFNHANLPPFISKQLIQHLVTSNPSPAYVGRVTAAFINNGAGVRGDMQAVIKAILLDAEARSATTAATASFGKLREPVVRFLNWARTYKANSASNAWAIGDLSDPAARLGQSPMRSSSVFNFFRPGYVPPDTALSAQSLTGPEFQITNESSVAGYVNYMQKVINGSAVGDLTPDYTDLLALAATSSSLLKEINEVLAGSQVSAATLATIGAAIDTMPSATNANLLNRVKAALVLVMASPEFIAQK
ncbi:MAG TPA: DUF1800 domain-containing protein [Burkholderiaceae bacterium]|jgi:uncharacterized protein (DUF1800 family)